MFFHFARFIALFSTDRQARRWLIGSALLCVLVFTITIPLPRVDGHLVGSDGLSYYAIARSLVFDQDFNFTNDYALLGVQRGNTAIGIPANPFAIGTPLLWVPFLGLAHILSLFLAALGLPVSLNGVGYVYEATVCYATILYATLGFWLTYRTARKFTSVSTAIFATLFMWWATPAIYYIVAEPSMSHALTVFSMALFLWVWYPPSQTRSTGDWVKIGLVTGLVALVRWQDGIVGIVPVVEICWLTAQRRLPLSKAFRYLVVYGGCTLVAFLPQFAMWYRIYGTFLTIPQGGDFFDWKSPQLLNTLFSTRHGLISWHPIFALALIGLMPLWKQNRALALTIAFIFVGELYINSSVSNWWADDAFGGRRFTSMIPLLTVALAALFGKLDHTRLRSLTYSFCAILVIWNGLSFAQYRLGYVEMNQALTLREMTIDRLLLPIDLIQRILR